MDPPTLNSEIARVMGTRERATPFPTPHLELRDATQTGDGSITVAGRAVVHETTTVLWQGDLFGQRYRVEEIVSEGALTGALQRAVAGVPRHCVLNREHQNMTTVAVLRALGEFGRVEVGGMKAWESTAGLDIFARLDGADQDAQQLERKMRLGLANEMSFRFTIADETSEELEDEDAEGSIAVYRYRIEEVDELRDLCICTQGAYPTTSAELRDAVSALRRRHAGSNPAGEPPLVTPEPSGGGTSPTRQRQLAALQAHAAVALHDLEALTP